MVDAIANLATATTSDPSEIAQLTANIVRLTMEIATVNEKLVVALHTKRASRGGCGGRDRAACRLRAGSG